MERSWAGKLFVFSTWGTITELNSFSQSRETGLGLKMDPTVLLSGIRQVSIVLFINKIIKVKYQFPADALLVPQHLKKVCMHLSCIYVCMYTPDCS